MPVKPEARFRIIVVEPSAGVTYAVQDGRSDLLSPIRSTPAELVFEFPLTVADVDADPPRLTGRFAQGPAKRRFVYVNSGTAAGQRGTQWTRRAKVPLHEIQRSVLLDAIEDAGGSVVVEASVLGTGKDGGPACASVPLLSDWAIATGARE